MADAAFDKDGFNRRMNGGGRHAEERILRPPDRARQRRRCSIR